MSIFSKIKGAKKAAKDHKQAQQGAGVAPEIVDKPIPYKHVPTHAAIDAMAGAPASYKEADQAEIKATNEKRRSMMTQNSSAASTTLNTTLNRNSSYGSTSNFSYSRPMPPRLEQRRSYGANGGYYNNGTSSGYQTFQPSPLASKGIVSQYICYNDSAANLSEGPSPTGSLNESSSSSSSRQSTPLDLRQCLADHTLDLVEMHHAAPAPTSYIAASPHTASASTSYGLAAPYASPAPKRFEQTMMETIHDIPHRKLGEAPVLSQPPPSVVKPAAAPTLVEAKKRSWGFGKRNSHGPAIAAH